MKLFDKIYDGAKEALKQMKKPLVERAFRRRFESFLDGCEDKISKLELEKHEYMTKLEDVSNYDINKIVRIELDIEQAKKAKSIGEAHQKEIFDTDVE